MVKDYPTPYPFHQPHAPTGGARRGYRATSMTTTQVQWISTAALQKLLRLGTTSIRELQSAGVFQPGTHFIRKGIGIRSPRLWDYEAVIDALRQQTTRTPEVYGPLD